MRILYIVTAFPRGADDVITPWLIETIKRLRDRGIEVEVLASSYRGSTDHTFEGIRVHRFRYAPAALETLTHDQTTPDRIREKPLYLALVPGYVIAGSLAAARLARTGRFDVVHAFWPLPHGLFGLAARSAGHVPLISTFFGVELTWLRRQLPFLAPLLRAIVRRSDAVTVISSHTAAELRSLAPRAVVRTIPFGATLEAVDPPRPARRDDNVRGEHRLLFVGRLVERKGVEFLLRAIARLRAKEGVRLTIVGDGPLRTPLERRAVELGIGDIVDFTGLVSAEELKRHFESGDIFILPAVRDSKGDVEGLGVVSIEAMSHGMAVIASDSGGIPDVVRDGETGLLVTPGDPDALAGAIDRLVRDRELAQRLGAAGREDVARRFSWERIAGDLAALYQELGREPAHGRHEPHPGKEVAP